MPEQESRGTRIALRPGLQTAAGRRLTGRDVVRSLERAQSGGAAGLIAAFGKPIVARDDPLAVILPATKEINEVAAALASPLTAIVPEGFSPRSPDGTGAFRARLRTDGLVLERNLRAARGPSFLERITVRRAADLSGALRAFEAGDADVGWLGRGLHRPRADAEPFEAGLWGWVILRTGRNAGAWGAPGVAAQLMDSIPAARLSHLGLRSLPSGRGPTTWGGPATALAVRADFPHLVQIARALGALLSNPGHNVLPTLVAPQQLTTLRRTGQFGLMVDFVRPLAGPSSVSLSLLTAADPDLARRPPREAPTDARRIARTLPLGIVGELHVFGAHAPKVRRLEEWSLGDVWRG
jgi:peptide/nickel transport system substrate-binding protein